MSLLRQRKSHPKGAKMIILAFLVTAFLAGALAGALILVVLAIRREDRGHLQRRPPTRATAAARHLTGLRVNCTRPAARAGLPARPAGHAARPGSSSDRAEPRPPRQALPTSSP